MPKTRTIKMTVDEFSEIGDLVWRLLANGDIGIVGDINLPANTIGYNRALQMALLADAFDYQLDKASYEAIRLYRTPPVEQPLNAKEAVEDNLTMPASFYDAKTGERI